MHLSWDLFTVCVTYSFNPHRDLFLNRTKYDWNLKHFFLNAWKYSSLGHEIKSARKFLIPRPDGLTSQTITFRVRAVDVRDQIIWKQTWTVTELAKACTATSCETTPIRVKYRDVSESRKCPCLLNSMNPGCNAFLVSRLNPRYPWWHHRGCFSRHCATVFTG